MTDSIVVAVRCRPLNERERQACRDAGGSRDIIVRIKDKQTTLLGDDIPKEDKERIRLLDRGKSYREDRTFSFDYSLWSVRETDAEYVNQEKVYEYLGKGLLDNAFAGYNACIFAYGQTGSGKTYTMMGTDDDAGLIPRICREMFARIAANTDPNTTYKVCE